MRPALVYMYTVLIRSSDGLMMASEGCAVRYCPAGVKRRLPSGAKVSRRKNEVWVSLAYKLWFLIVTAASLGRNGFGEFSIGRTAGRGIDGAGDADLRIDAEEPNEDRLLCDIAGGSIGNLNEFGVPGIDGTGDAGLSEAESVLPSIRKEVCCGAGLFEGCLRPGRSIFVTLL